MAKTTQNVLVRQGGEPLFLEAGTEVPEWALDQVGDHVLDEPKAPKLPDASDGYDKLTAKDLKVLIAARNADRDPADAIVPDSSRKDDLVAALELDDEASADPETTGGDATP